ncbi:hypothetical protein [Pedobacter sp. ASV28]|uniref:hypothetical protein n=1 Tax=Pedobacter sp. ASV28 TaxID=2795123 RepID=UPI001E31A340|nr:hypothetical protein [Pedobacter sp. ASV28]
MISTYIKNKVNPYLYQLFPQLAENGVPFELDPLKLVWDSRRFDLATKYTYLKYKNKYSNLSWPKALYQNHIHAFTEGSFTEGDGSKSNLSDYIKNFEILEEKFKSNLFDKEKSYIPFKNNINTDGSHRISLAAYYHKKLVGVPLAALKEPNYNYVYFRERKQENWVNDFVFLQHVLHNQNMRIIHVHPKAKLKTQQITEILAQHGIRVEYDKTIKLNKFAHGLYVRELYKNESWIGSSTNNYEGAFNHAAHSYSYFGKLRIFFVKEDRPDVLRKIKTTIREICNIGNYSVHINDTHNETVALAHILLNDNSISFINECHNNITFWKTDKFVKYFANTPNITEKSDDFIFVGSLPLAMTGLRENRDTDIICASEQLTTIKEILPDIDCHNQYMKQFNFNIIELLTDPRQSYYWQGFKFLSLQNVWKLKRQRKEFKDYLDFTLSKTSSYIPLPTNKIYHLATRLKFKIS